MTRKVTNLAKCKKCNSETVTWAKGKKTGKFYLTEVFIDEEGDTVSDRTDFHSTYCGNPALHEAKQASLTADDGGIKNGVQVGRAMELRAQASAIETADYFLKLHDLCKSDRHAGRAHLSALIAERAKGDDARREAEISFVFAALGTAKD